MAEIRSSIGPPAWICNWAILRKIFPHLDYMRESISLLVTMEDEQMAKMSVKAKMTFIY